MIIPHFDLPPQFTYELFHIYFTPKTVVSSAYKETLFTFSPTLMHFILSSFLTALASNSMPITDSSPNKGQPCLTLRSKRKNSDANPLFTMQLET